MIAVVRERLADEIRGRLQVHTYALKQLPADEPESMYERALHERAIASLRPIVWFLGHLSGSDPRLAQLQSLDPSLRVAPGSSAEKVLDALETDGRPSVPTLWLDRFVAACVQDNAAYRVF